MKIKEITPKPFEGSVHPGIQFDVAIGYQRYSRAIIDVNGWLKTSDGKIIAELREDIPEKQVVADIAARGSSFDSRFNEETYKTTLLAFLNERSLNHIEEQRAKDAKGDVWFILELKVETLESKAQVSHVHELNPRAIEVDPVEILTPTGKLSSWSFLVYSYCRDFATRTGNLWILSGDDGPVFMAISVQALRKKVRIPSADWIHDFAPKLGLGEYFIVEIPRGSPVIEEAWEQVEKAEVCFRHWDLGGVYAYCREVGTLLDKVLKEHLGKDSFDYKERWGRAYGKFEHMSSLGLHLQDISKNQKYSPEDIRVGREDAEHLLMSTKLLIKYAEELLKRKELR